MDPFIFLFFFFWLIFGVLEFWGMGKSWPGRSRCAAHEVGFEVKIRCSNLIYVK
jgi:hypothetical protein